MTYIQVPHKFCRYRSTLTILWCVAVFQLSVMLWYPDEVPWMSLISRHALSGRSKSCPVNSPKLVGPVKVLLENVSEEQILRINSQLEPGGRFQPKECVARHKVAVVVPFRDRDEHLRIFLNNLHPFLQRQQLDYGIFIVEQSSPKKFNRGALMNVGYLEARRAYNYDCFIFHDVDLLPENDWNLYSCPSQPRHMSVAIDKFDYNLPYHTILGGVTAFTDKQFATVNGFSNVYWGWGGEDDDLSLRVINRGFNISRYPAELARYKMVKHGSDPSNPINPIRFELLGAAATRFLTDGLSNLAYAVLGRHPKPLYTLLVVDIGPPSTMSSHSALNASQPNTGSDVAKQRTGKLAGI